MEMKSIIGKLFVVLVAGGAAVAGANDLTDTRLENTEEQCQVELVRNSKFAPKTVQCLDDITDHEEILQLVEEAKQEDCLSPQCGCWLG